jgi:hypothetical protein
VRQQLVGEVRADEARASGDQDPLLHNRLRNRTGVG